MSKFIVVKDETSKVRRFNLKGRRISFKLNPVPAEEKNPVSWFKDAIREIVRKITADTTPDERVGFNFCDRNFSRGTGWINFKPASELQWVDVWNLIAKIYQSNSEGLNTETFCLEFVAVKLPQGRGNPRKASATYNTFEEECKSRRGIVPINNKDNLCLPRALVVAQALGSCEYRRVRRDVGKIQTSRALMLAKEAGVVIPEEGCGIAELQKFQDCLQDYTITVYLYGVKGRNVLFKGTSGGTKKINLIYHKGHYNLINSLTAAFSCSYFCEECATPYDSKNKHRCIKICSRCQGTPPCVFEEEKKCLTCNREFKSQKCYDQHGPICASLKKCPDCLKIFNLKIRKQQPHVCNEVYCKMCQSYKPQGHMCYIRQDLRKPPQDKTLFVFYDLETQQDVVQEDGSALHVPNLCVFQQRCIACLNEERLMFCKDCGFRQQVLRGPKCVEELLNFLLEARKKFKIIICMAHNGQAFDHQFILNYVLTQTRINPRLIMRGSKIILMQIENIRFLDSLNYFPMALSALPKAFGLGPSLKKGYFPHRFNTRSNEQYVGPLPSVDFYEPDNMKTDARAAFMVWYKEEVSSGRVFELQKELLEYCISDVNILTQACIQFRDMLLNECNVCPFTEATTIASACNRVYRRNFLEADTIGIIPKNGYRMKDKQSKIALQWLLWEEKERGIEIQHAGRDGGEAIIGGMKVDGFCGSTKQIFEFQGCLFHGHDVCLKYGRQEPLHDDPADTLERRFEKTVSKTAALKKLGYEVVEMWECNFRKKLDAADENMKNYLDAHPMLLNSPLNPRDAFYGGRTEAIKLKYEIKPGEKIKYYDICSLYSFCCKYKKYPVGHPTMHVGDEACRPLLASGDGLIKCKVLPPRDLYLPVLPVKMHNKLLFGLCGKCMSEMAQECDHMPQDRAFVGTWVVDEVRKAIEKGYEVLDIQEFWQYKVRQMSAEEEGLFTEFINRFLKMKQQASGWPSNCSSQQEKEQYIEEYLNSEGVQLEFDKIVKNPGLRALAKLILNSFWGKFGQRENQPQTSVINDPEEFFALMTNPSVNVNHVMSINEDTLVVAWEYKDEAADSLATVNVCIAAYTTTHARLKLYEHFETLGERLLYADTDSVIFVSREGLPEPCTGSFLGDLTDEVEDEFKDGAYITLFASGGPKNYGYVVYSPATGLTQTKFKVKGITLNFKTAQQVNLDALLDLIDGDIDDHRKIIVDASSFRRTDLHEVVTVKSTKTYRVNFLKRKRIADHGSLPFGYKKSKTE